MGEVEKQADGGPDYGLRHMGIQGYSILATPSAQSYLQEENN